MGLNCRERNNKMLQYSERDNPLSFLSWTEHRFWRSSLTLTQCIKGLSFCLLILLRQYLRIYNWSYPCSCLLCLNLPIWCTGRALCFYSTENQMFCSCISISCLLELLSTSLCHCSFLAPNYWRFCPTLPRTASGSAAAEIKLPL